MKTSLRLAAVCATLAMLTACGGAAGGYGSIFNPGNPSYGGGYGSTQCDPGTQVQLANPMPYQTNVNTSIGQITIVADGNANPLGDGPQYWQLNVSDGGGPGQGDSFYTNALQPVPDPSGPHPYGSDYYYQGTFSYQLLPGQNWTVTLINTAGGGNYGQGCTSGPIVGNFST